MSLLRRLLEAIFPPRAPVTPAPAPVEPAPPVAAAPLERVVFAFAVASSKAKVYGERLTYLLEHGTDAEKLQAPHVREAAIQALAEMERYTETLAEHMPPGHAGRVMASIYKARQSLGVAL